MKKILIITDDYDYSSINVIKWIKAITNLNNVFFIRSKDLINNRLNIDIMSNSVTIDSSYGKIKSSDIIAVWTRKWNNEISNISSYAIPHHQLKSMQHYLSKELSTLFEYFIFSLNQDSGIFWVNHPQHVTPNKLIQLAVAQKLGLATPKSIVVNQHIPNSYEKHYITKPLSNCYDIRTNNTIYTNYTSELTGKESYDDLFISFVQENIPKEAEIRVFYLLGKCYALLIHSQNNKKTQTDYRKYDYKRPNRLEPCQLPLDIESKIDAFMHAMNLQTGSLDFILTPSGEYVFLEVNPCGQYDIFNSCNIYPDKLIAEALISKLQ